MNKTADGSLRMMSDRRNYMPSDRDGKGSRNHREQKEKDHRAEIQKTAVRVCGDWSEHISSSGKRYFYNCKTEQSQWERPKEWVEKQERQERPDRFNRSTKNDNGRDERHEKERFSRPGSSNYRQADDQHHQRYNRGGPVRHERHDHYDRHQERQNRERPNVDRYHHKGAININHHPNNFGHREVQHVRKESEDSRQMEDMDISPGSTPTEESVLERGLPSIQIAASTPSSVNAGNIPLVAMTSSTSRNSASVLDSISSLPQSILSNIGGAKELQSLNNQDMTQQAIRTLAKLQQALQEAQQQQQRQLQSLLVQQIKQQIEQAQQHSRPSVNSSALDEGSQSPYSPPDSDGTPLQSPECRPSSNILLRLQEEDCTLKGRDSPCQSEVSMRSTSKRGSPAPSVTSSQGVPISSQLAAAHRKSDSVQLTPSLANYYNANLIDHVMNKPAEAVEAQGDRVREESLTVGGLQCTQVTAELKRDRSLVRLAEIQSTLQEQRVLFLRQQIKDLENM